MISENLKHSKMTEPSNFCIFTDGSALGNKQNAPAGAAFYIPSMKKLFSKSMYGTNNQAELEAIRYALWYFRENLSKNIKGEVEIFTDSSYSINAISGKWKKITINLEKIELIRQWILELKANGTHIKFIHVDAHTGKKDFVSINNDIVDKEARRQALLAKNKIISNAV